MTKAILVAVAILAVVIGASTSVSARGPGWHHPFKSKGVGRFGPDGIVTPLNTYCGFGHRPFQFCG